MCGIVGVAGNAKAQDIVLNGLARLEYRGYDSAGVAVSDGQSAIHVRKEVGKLEALRGMLQGQPLPATSLAIGHTRWATHGVPSALNSHPHVNGGMETAAKVALVHNGIIENYLELRAELGAEGFSFASDTDTETLPCLLSRAIGQGKGLAEAARAVADQCRGSFAWVAMVEGQPDVLVATRRGAPLCVGLAKDGNYVASDPLALAGVCSKFVYLLDDDVAVVKPSGVEIFDKGGHVVDRPAKHLDLAAEMAGKQGYKHYMLKEIYEQPVVASGILEAYTKDGEILLELPESMKSAPMVNIVACGTAYYAGMVGKYALEQVAGITVNVDMASEFRYRNPPYLKGGVMVVVSQSGETADTLAALEHAKEAGQTIVVLTNVTTSSMARAADVVIDLKAGREVAVASTKAFTAMVLVLELLALKLGRLRGTVSAEAEAGHVKDLRRLPLHLMNVLAESGHYEELAFKLADAKDPIHSMLYLGRGWLTPIAYEGALKMKEISYIHAEAYASGEMKHGPIALVDATLPVVNIAASNDGLFEKTLSNMKEVEARKGQVILLTDTDGAALLDAETRAKVTLLTVPTVPPLLLPLVMTVPLQILAYQTAVSKGTDVDQPRNLAKSVTVE